MALLYVANTTKQHHEFLYRIPGEVSVRKQKIVSGGQERIYNDVGIDILMAIVAQHVPYGMKDELDAKNTRDIAPLVFSIGKPVNLDRLLQAFDQNDTVMDEVAGDRREEVAAAIASDLEAQIGVEMTNVTVEIKEDTKPGETARVNSGVEVTRNPETARHSKDVRPPGRSRRVSLA